MNELKSLTAMTELETSAVLKAAARAEAKLGELKGFVRTVPNKVILLNTLPLQEAKASSEIENIVTTADELFSSMVDDSVNGHAKEVRAHSDALLEGFRIVETKKMLRLEDVIHLQSTLIKNQAGLRTQVGTVLKNNAGKVIYTPPPPNKVPGLMANLLEFINAEQFSDLNALVKMAIIHHQFESIHPFYDGNGRTGRIINILYLVLAKRLDLPVIYLSHYIITHKAKYYELLQAVREQGDWEQWLLFMLEGIYQTSITTIQLIHNINKLLLKFKHEIRKNHSRLYSQDLINSMFKHPYTKIKFVQADLGCSYKTARDKLEKLAAAGFLQKTQLGRSNYYVNDQLVACLMATHDNENP